MNHRGIECGHDGADWPADGVVHLWSVPRSHRAQDKLAEQGLTLLSTSEHGRLALLSRPTARRQFLLGRTLMRIVLADYLGLDARSIELAREPHGKPCLKQATARGLAFNLTHSGEEIVLAVSYSCRIGVDLERLDRRASALRIAKSFFSTEERLGFQHSAGPRDPAEDRALVLWTLKESVGKAIGGSVWDAIEAVRLNVLAGKVTWVMPPPAGGQEGAWGLLFGLWGRQHLLALACYRQGGMSAPLVSNVCVVGCNASVKTFRPLGANDGA